MRAIGVLVGTGLFTLDDPWAIITYLGLRFNDAFDQQPLGLVNFFRIVGRCKHWRIGVGSLLSWNWLGNHFAAVAGSEKGRETGRVVSSVLPCAIIKYLYIGSEKGRETIHGNLAT